MKRMDFKAKTIEKIRAYIRDGATAWDDGEAYDSVLDECYSMESVGGPFVCLSPSRVLRECDPTAYRCGKNDFVDGELSEGLIVEVAPEEYYTENDVREMIESFSADEDYSEAERELAADLEPADLA